MLLARSIVLHTCVLLLCATARSQHYDSEYHVDEGDDHSSYNEGDDRPDYSKYFNQDTSSPLVSSAPLTASQPAQQEESSGFVSPLDFTGFFASPNFGLGAASSPQVFQPVVQNNNKQSAQGFVNPGEFQAAAQQAGFQQHTFHPVAGPQFPNYFDQGTPTAGYVAQHKNPDTYKKQNSEVDDLNGYKEEYNYKDDNDDDEGNGKAESYNKQSSYNYNPPPKKLSYSKSKYAAVQPTGKTAHVSPVKNYSPHYYASNKYTNVQPTLTPYQKYSFQPVQKSASFETIKSTSLPYTSTSYQTSAPYALPSTVASYYSPTTEYADATDVKSQKAKGNCKRIEKQISPEDLSHGRFRRNAEEMNCFLCQDPKTGGSYEQCSYTSDPNNSEYFRGQASKYSTVSNKDPEEHSRQKRSTKSKKDRRNKRQKEEAEQQEEEVEEYSNPYNDEKSKAHTFNSKPAEFDSDNYYKAPDFNNYKEDYRFGPEYFTDSTNEEKSYSEQQSDELKKNSANCKKVQKDSLTCMVCANPKTGGNYEQCSYSSEPEEKKYSYVKEKKYNSNDPEGETTKVESTENKPTVRNNKARKQRQKQKPEKKSSYNEEYDNYRPASNTKRQRKVKKPVENTQEYDVFHPSPNTRKENKYRGLNPDLYGQAEPSEEQEQKTSPKTSDDYVYKLFPEYAEKESAIKEIKRKPGFQYNSELPEYFTAEESKKDVDSVLAEFAKKDRSNCKKVAKNKMTCFICTDAKGVQHEECMFVSESQPKSSHVAYHEVKEFTSDPKGAENKQETVKVKPNVEAAASSSRGQKQKYPKKTAPAAPLEKNSEPSSASSSKAPRIVRRKTNINKEFLETHNTPIQKREAKQEAKQEVSEEQRTDEGFDEVKEVQIENGDGAYASELVPVYSKKLGTTLPAYMLDISEHEKIFDEVMGV